MNVVELAYTLTAPAEAVAFFMMFDAFSEKRRKFTVWQYMLGLVALAAMIWFANDHLMFRMENAVGMIAAALIASFWFYRGTIRKRIMIALSTWLIMSVAEIIVLNLISLIFNITITESVQISVYLVLGIVVSKTLAIAVCYAIRVKTSSKQMELNFAYWILFVVLFSGSILATFMIYWMLYALNDPRYNLMALISCIGLYLSTFLALFLYERSVKQNQIIRLQEQAEQQMRHQLKHLDEIILKQNELRKVRHDMKNHLIALYGYFDKGKINEGKRHIVGLAKELDFGSTIFDTGNDALDAILSAKKSLAESKGIVFDTEIRIRRMLPIDPRDLCIIFGNALDNAIEACDRLPASTEKRIVLFLRQDAHSLFCEIKNSASMNPTGIFLTSKADPFNHGFGLGNIKEALEKYGSEPLIEQESDSFSLSFVIFFQSVDSAEQ